MQKNKPQPIIYTQAGLIASLKAKDNRAFSFLYDNYHEALFRAIKKIITDHNDASDVIQDVFINIYRKIESYDASKGRLFTWMLNIAVNASVDKVKSASHRHIKNTCSLDKVTGSRLWVVAPHISDIGITKRLALLNAKQGELIHLLYFKGFTHEQISLMRGIPVGTVKSRIRIALRQLKQFLIVENGRTQNSFS
jgi:RNA polymerase sigma factor (sigma-70 family)